MTQRRQSGRKRQSGGGMTPPRSAEEMRILARAAALPAIARLAALSNSEDERVALAATQELLNRAFGKIAAAGGEEAQAPAQQLVIRVLRFGADDPEGGPAKDSEPQTSAAQRVAGQNQEMG